MIDPRRRQCMERCCFRLTSLKPQINENNKEKIIVSEKDFFFMTKIKESILICGRIKSNFPFSLYIGPDWPLVLFVYFLIILVHAIVLYFTSPLGWPPIFIALVGFVVIISSYSYTVFSDPGIIYENDYQLPDPFDVEKNEINNSINSETKDVMTIVPTPVMTLNECGSCETIRPKSASHCYYCKVCVDKLDHHCVWCGKCIGKYNIYSFNIFTGSLQFQIYYLLGLVIYYLIWEYSSTTFLPSGPSF